MNSPAETGDLLFALVNLARHVGADPDLALRGTNAKFERRFGYIEQALEAQGRSLEAPRWRRWTRCGMKRSTRRKLLRADYLRALEVFLESFNWRHCEWHEMRLLHSSASERNDSASNAVFYRSSSKVWGTIK